MAAQQSAEPSALRWFARRVVRHVRWARTEGLRRLIAEDRLDPRVRIRTAWTKARWRQAHGVPPGAARAVYLVGLQRSGTNMLVRGLDEAPEVEARNENDRGLFHRFRLRGDDVLLDVLGRSRHLVVLVKPLCDSHRVADLLALSPGARALWMWRDVDDRARSEVAKFGDANLRALRAIAAGDTSIWQAGGIDPARLDGFDLETMDPHTGAALFWCLRNELYFDLGLDQRDDVLLVSYGRMVADPAAVAEQVCRFMGLPYRPSFAASVSAGPPRPRLPIDPRVRELCDALTARLLVGARG
ncbi:sulfotransferase [Actinoplanes sp. NPDC051633]|uniref:sulfotransferase family protein n=1 Tax=Actinoplanes sp. NPDC051633 TaxID=3155670 RepID=UPI0034312DE5